MGAQRIGTLFQRTDPGRPDFAEATAYSLSGDGAVPLPAPIVQNATIGAYSFPQFGAQQATITVRLPPQSLSAVLSFQPQDSERISDRTFTHSQPSFVYKWNVTSISPPASATRLPLAPGRLMSPATKRSISRVIHHDRRMDPQRTLQNFLLDRALAFHDQTRPSGCYTYGNYTPQVVQETPAGKISSLHLLTSPGGGLATFIAPKLPVDRAAIEDYIRRHFVPAPETITLEQEEIQQSLWLHRAAAGCCRLQRRI